MRHFDEPTLNQFDLNNFKLWIMATDGFWVDHVLLGRDFVSLPDDASVLTLTSTSSSISADTDCPNFECQGSILMA